MARKRPSRRPFEPPQDRPCGPPQGERDLALRASSGRAGEETGFPWMTSRMRGVTRKRSEAKGRHVRKAKASDHVVNDFEVSFVEIAFVEGIMGPGEGCRSCGPDACSSSLAGGKRDMRSQGTWTGPKIPSIVESPRSTARIARSI